jgi:uncharacterized protein DUF1931
MAISDETEAQLPELAGGLSVALAHTFNTIEPTLRHPTASTRRAASASSTSSCRFAAPFLASPRESVYDRAAGHQSTGGD